MRLLVAAMIFAANGALADTPAATKASDAPPQSIWRLSGGGYEHLQSGLVCPDTFVGYRRTNVERFDNYGLDVGCSYTIGSAALTFYLTRREGAAGLDAAGGISELADEPPSTPSRLGGARRSRLATSIPKGSDDG